ncbi:MAG: queuosine precursor transporter [Vampirovibrionales bacterium]|nr:queuosine precursor transporter [Vampirovibrionales bacterium]
MILAPSEAVQRQNDDRHHHVYLWLCAVFLTALLVANLIGSLLFSFHLPFKFPILGNKVLLSAGIIPFPITFVLTDLLNEFYGKSGAQRVTMIGFVMSIGVFLLLWIGQQLPVDTVSSLSHQEFDKFASLYTAMFAASLTAYLIGQMLDIYLFNWFKTICGNLLWLRATGSTVLSQLFDSLIVTSIAFAGSQTWSTIAHIAMSNYVWKFLVALSLTPILYLGHALLKSLLRPQQRASIQAFHAEAIQSVSA